MKTIKLLSTILNMKYLIISKILIQADIDEAFVDLICGK